MEPVMRVSVRNGQEIPLEVVLIDAFGLAVLFSTLKEVANSGVYAYEGVQFWRANHEFVVSFAGESFIVTHDMELEDFHLLLLKQKAS
jgi:hypothetical protein